MTAGTLTRSMDRKVTNLVAVSKKTGNVRPAIANAFGLPSGKRFSCAGETPFCADICYAGEIERLRANVSALLIRNWNALQGASYDDMVSMLDAMVSEFETECDRRGAERLFRIHWDGDLFSGTYTSAWAKVIANHPDVQFWLYTRVATAATYLHSRRLPNLALYFSADRDNLTVARHLATKGIRIAYVGQTFADGKAELPHAVRCPENNKAIPLIDAKGSACGRCGLCVHGRRDVVFSVTKS
jgi:hypothetical protein